ncbi:GspH/FimT family pseudopilin [Billgrantia endophytica]|uniref:Type II secretion system protein H n=1 Tax=Billgrantia endophytica TaxID=2033802 RepID=A0A2N7U634_9GAMM|nr:GspH/FimT family pseudopilin [Halomonas endophytica]PMR75890.1 pilus assembly protein [Halomonas endophytica]
MQTPSPDGPGPRHRSSGTRQLGFTLVELLVVMALLAILFGWAVPGFQAMNARHEVITEVQRIKTALALARNTAITRRTSVTLCPSQDRVTCSTDDWTAPLVVVLGDLKSGNIGNAEILRVFNGSRVVSTRYRQDGRPVRYGPLGRPAGHNGTFRICGREDTGAQVILSNFGRVRVDSTPSC